VRFTLLVDGDALDAFNLSCELSQQFVETPASTFEVVSCRASESQACLARVLELAPVLFRQEIALERLVATATEHVQVAGAEAIVQRLERRHLVHAGVDVLAPIEHQSTPTVSDVADWGFHLLGSEP
jgi:hypothetical protein